MKQEDLMFRTYGTFFTFVVFLPIYRLYEAKQLQQNGFSKILYNTRRLHELLPVHDVGCTGA